MRTAVVLFTRDLRVHDNPALHLACTTAESVVPLFVVDPRVDAGERRHRFLLEALADLRESLRRRGGDLVVRDGDPVTETVKLAREVDAFTIVAAADVSSYAQRRERRLAQACAEERIALTLVESVTVVPAGLLRPSGGGDHYRVFTPYWRAWRDVPSRPELSAPPAVTLPASIESGRLPTADHRTDHVRLMSGGETEGRRRLAVWRAAVAGYSDSRNDLATDGTSRLSPYLHFGCVSSVTVASRTSGSEEFLRQLCWRDFFHQVLRAFPALPREAYRGAAAERWRADPDALEAWQAGHTGVPIVDAGMRQLAVEGWLPGRVRMITASFLTKQLGIDWRDGTAWYQRHLLDADVANNSGNWQWVAGTGNDTRPYRRFNPVRQAERHDPDGDYVRRWLPALAGVPAPQVHRPIAARTGAVR